MTIFVHWHSKNEYSVSLPYVSIATACIAQASMVHKDPHKDPTSGLSILHHALQLDEVP